MRVICIEDSLWVDGPYRGQPSAHKGSIYHVTASYSGEQVRIATGLAINTKSTWYTFLETVGAHDSVRFLELPDDDFEEGIQEEQIAIEEELAKLN
jgi:hypothetical protein